MLRFHADSSGRYIDFEITLHALPDTPLVMGDNKDGTMAMRLAEWMTMPHKVKGAETGGTGHIVTARGDRDASAWGKRADWCDYHADHNGQTYGVAIFDHLDNLRHPDLVDGPRLRAFWRQPLWPARLRKAQGPASTSVTTSYQPAEA